MSTIMPVNPAEFMGDVVVKEGMKAEMTTDTQKTEAFRAMLAEELFLKGFFNTENSIFKPAPEDSLFSSNRVYGELAQKEFAKELVKNGLLTIDEKNQ